MKHLSFFLLSAAVFLGGCIVVLGIWEAVVLSIECCNASLYLYYPFALIWLGISPLIVWSSRRRATRR
jgi:hypothetical protein